MVVYAELFVAAGNLASDRLLICCSIEISDISIPNLTFDPADFVVAAKRPGFLLSSILPLVTLACGSSARQELAITLHCWI